MTHTLAHELKQAGFPGPIDGNLDDITPLLPTTFALEYWDGKPSCTNRDEENPLRTFGDTFAEAAARMWLEIKKAPL